MKIVVADFGLSDGDNGTDTEVGWLSHYTTCLLLSFLQQRSYVYSLTNSMLLSQ
jgi:hypothetical protein